MIWNDIVLNLNLTNEELAKQLAKVFNVETEQVTVSDAIENIDEFLLVTCIRNKIRGDFNTVLNFYLDFQPDDTFDYLKKLSKSLDSEILTSDELTADPYSMLLIKGNGNSGKVRIVADKLDDKDEYYLEDVTNNS